MKIAYFDCFSGISGDMTLGALVDAGAPLEALRQGLARLPVGGWKLTADKVRKAGVAATFVRVEITAQQHHHRHLRDILKMIESAELPPRAAERATNIFRRLGEAEARIHGVPIEKVHFHEVGAVDAIVDIAGAALALELLGIERVYGSPVNVGGGTVGTEHGTLPVPAPASVELLRGAPTYSSGIEKELTTPTGAAILSTLAAGIGAQPAMKVAAVGYGAGSWDLPGQPNVLRVMVGEAAAADAGAGDETLSVLETNLDDMTPEVAGWVMEQALAAGALDVFSSPVQMKKNRPGLLLTVLCEPAAAERLTALLFRETTTLGVRSHTVRRRALDRTQETVQTPWGAVAVKVARLDGAVVNAAPEYEDCARVARERGVPLKQVMAEAQLAFAKRTGKSG
jgi:pyridinium-3,5-bisthiocarboxylic acid mononucleotide nickel chelatase